ncbi:MAG: cell division protein FtsA [bacterium]|nr:cell division protein FtsA [bacterium]
MQIAALDIGSQNIKVLVGDTKKDGTIRLLRILKMPAEGMRRGTISDLDDAAASVGDAIQILRKEYRVASKNIFVSVNGPQVASHISKGIIAVSRADSEIYQDDVDRVVKASQAINISPNRKIIHTITREFIVDGIHDVQDPAGLVGSRLEVESVVIEVFATYLKNLSRVIEVSGGRVGGFILGSIASSRAALTKKQKELGVAILDIGAQTAALSVYEESKLLHVAVLPIGAAHISNDVAIGFKIPVHEAETLKLHFGYALSKHVAPKEMVEPQTIAQGVLRNQISRRFLSEIVQSRLAEIFEFVNSELKQIGKYGELPAGLVLVGGGAKLPGIADLARQELRISTQIGIPLGSFEIVDNSYEAELEDPEFVCAAGLLLLGAPIQSAGSFLPTAFGDSWFSFIKSFLKNLLP